MSAFLYGKKKSKSGVTESLNYKSRHDPMERLWSMSAKAAHRTALRNPHSSRNKSATDIGKRAEQRETAQELWQSEMRLTYGDATWAKVRAKEAARTARTKAKRRATLDAARARGKAHAKIQSFLGKGNFLR